MSTEEKLQELHTRALNLASDLRGLKVTCGDADQSDWIEKAEDKVDEAVYLIWRAQRVTA